MSLFDIFRRKAPSDQEMQQQLVKLVLNRMTDRDNRIRAEDTLCAAGAIVGERCIDAAGDYSLREHDNVPGKRVFSDRANELLCGDNLDAGITPDSIYGQLKAGVKQTAYPESAFPDVATVFRGRRKGSGSAKGVGRRKGGRRKGSGCKCYNL